MGFSKNIVYVAGKSCRLRWYNQLDPNINKKPFTEEEEEKLLAAHGIYGNKWACIAKYFQGRTDNAVKNHYHVVMARRRRERFPLYDHTKKPSCSEQDDPHHLINSSNTIRPGLGFRSKDYMQSGNYRKVGTTFGLVLPSRLSSKKNSGCLDESTLVKEDHSQSLDDVAVGEGRISHPFDQFLNSDNKACESGENERRKKNKFQKRGGVILEQEHTKVAFIDFLGVGIS